MTARIPFDLDRLQELIAQDKRVVALFVTGSHAEGRADVHSDLDLLAVTDKSNVEELAGHFTSLVNTIEPLVDACARALGPATLLNLVTARCVRLDVVVTTTENVAQAPRFGTARPLFDRAGVLATLPAISGPVGVPHGEEWFDSLVKGVLRTVALLPMILAREEFIRGAQHVQLLKQDFLELLLFAEGDPPLTRPGAWAWSELNTRLSPERREHVAALPASAMTPGEVIDGHIQVLNAFLGVARQIAQNSEFDWKHSAYEKAVDNYLVRSGLSR